MKITFETSGLNGIQAIIAAPFMLGGAFLTASKAAAVFEKIASMGGFSKISSSLLALGTGWACLSIGFACAAFTLASVFLLKEHHLQPLQNRQIYQINISE